MHRLSAPSSSSLSDVSSQASSSTLPRSHKVKYQGAGDHWDCLLESEHEPIDVSLVLPHYRARNQPLQHRMNMYVASEEGDLRVKVCRPFSSHRCAFYLEAFSSTSDVTVWLPSDFQGRINIYSTSSSSSTSSLSTSRSKLVLSPGFSNKIMRNVQLFLDSEPFQGSHGSETDGLDGVDIRTGGNVSLKMWDVKTCAPEVKSRETLKRIFCSRTKKPVKGVNWDFLLDDWRVFRSRSFCTARIMFFFSFFFDFTWTVDSCDSEWCSLQKCVFLGPLWRDPCILLSCIVWRLHFDFHLHILDIKVLNL